MEQKPANKYLALLTAPGGAAGPTSPLPEARHAKKTGLKFCTEAGLNSRLCSKELAGENKIRQ